MTENTEAMQLWLSVRTQWRAGGMGVIGLDYAEVRRWARDLDIILSPGMWSKIRCLEFCALKAAHAEDDGQRGQKPAS